MSSFVIVAVYDKRGLRWMTRCFSKGVTSNNEDERIKRQHF